MYNSYGISWVVVAWVTAVAACLACLLRLYSRIFLTRSVGSDDYLIAVSMALTFVGTIINSLEVHEGLGRHQSTLTPSQQAEEKKWEYVAWLIVYCNFFFLRTSVMMFVLRLLPAFKKVQKWVVYVALAVNFAITIVVTVSYGLSCMPLRAEWENIPGAKCYSKDVLVITSIVNGALSCVIDVVTAFVPLFLLWNVQMRPRTKRILYLLFAGGMATAAMSIGRAATTTEKALTVDTTHTTIPLRWFMAMEDNFGILFACGPAIRQFFAYRRRVGTVLPTAHRQAPDEDFAKTRRRINLRDIFWYRKPELHGGRVVEALPGPQAEAKNEKHMKTPKSVLELWHFNVRNLFSFGSESRGSTSMNRHMLGTPSSGPSAHTSPHANSRDDGAMTDTMTSTQEKRSLRGKYDLWGLLPNKAKNSTSSSGNTTRAPFLFDDSAANASGMGSQAVPEATHSDEFEPHPGLREEEPGAEAHRSMNIPATFSVAHGEPVRY